MDDEWTFDENFQVGDGVEETQQVFSLKETITNKVHRVEFENKSKRDLLSYALDNPNCVIRAKTKWRCTCYTKTFSVNMFLHGVWVLASKEDDVEVVKSNITQHFGEQPKYVEVQNKTMIFSLGVIIHIDELFDFLNQNNEEGNGINLLDRDRFPAIICRMKKNKNTTLEIYHKGHINATGMKTDEDVEEVRVFIKNRIIPFITNHI